MNHEIEWRKEGGDRREAAAAAAAKKGKLCSRIGAFNDADESMIQRTPEMHSQRRGRGREGVQFTADNKAKG